MGLPSQLPSASHGRSLLRGEDTKAASSALLLSEEHELCCGITHTEYGRRSEKGYLPEPKRKGPETNYEVRRNKRIGGGA